ncbi:Glutathione S-transferase-like protein ustS [Psilocybe cubensis]|uniref:Glutathione S-transferase-like protein ustS n=1 Tax=Psilocybe cubensis TaxID=181762 RepID=A0ACB8H0X0_PSICU|nr:Glutathione S-transferase-like protein ustS [Psilocybe cubensis]KAH9480845.1 Glutathione S-transferase-like protein ustS [Psilocybe cubensis]
MAIVLYDLASTSPGYSMSTNTWKIRYCLNYKGIPFSTEWVEFPDISGLYERLGVTPTLKRSDGTPLCTVPMIYDSTTKKYVSDSIRIAEYLESQYPQTPSVFPSNTGGLIQAFAEATRSYLTLPARELLIWTIFVKLNPPSAAYFRNQTEVAIGKTMEELVPAADMKDKMKSLEEVLAKIDGLYSKNGGKGPYIMGESVWWSGKCEMDGDNVLA